MIPPVRFSRTEYFCLPGLRLMKSPGTTSSKAESGETPRRRAWPMWLTSKRPACSRVHRCSLSTPSVYCTGIS